MAVGIRPCLPFKGVHLLLDNDLAGDKVVVNPLLTSTTCVDQPPDPIEQEIPGSNWCFSFAPELVGYSAPRDLHRRAAYSVCESWFLIHQDVHHDLFVCS